MAMDWLSRREHTLAELKFKLAAREFADEEIEATVAALADEGLASDQRFAESLVAARTRRGQGPVRIRVEMERKGVSADLIRIQLDQAGHDWIARASEVRSKRFGDAAPADYREKTRQARFLQYRGFSSEQIRAVLAAAD